MKKVLIQVEETIRYEDEIVVIQPENITNEQFDRILNETKREAETLDGGAKELAHILERLGLEVESQTFNYPDSPKNSESEILNVKEIK